MKILLALALSIFFSVAQAAPTDDSPSDIYHSADWKYGEERRRESIMFLYGIKHRHGEFGSYEIADFEKWLDTFISKEKSENRLIDADDIVEMMREEVRERGVPQSDSGKNCGFHLT